MSGKRSSDDPPGSSPWLSALFRVACVHTQTRHVFLEGLSPADLLGARDAQRLADCFPRRRSRKALPYGFRFAIGGRGLLLPFSSPFCGPAAPDSSYHGLDKPIIRFMKATAPHLAWSVHQPSLRSGQYLRYAEMPVSLHSMSEATSDCLCAAPPIGWLVRCWLPGSVSAQAFLARQWNMPQRWSCVQQKTTTKIQWRRS